MGIVKYYEDNMKIREERYLLMREEEPMPIYRRRPIAETTYINTKEVIIDTTKNKKQKRKTEKMLCCECNAAFLFTGGEQKFYEDHKLSKPKRCPQCRKKNKKKNETKGI